MRPVGLTDEVQLFAGLEANGFARSNGDFGTCAWVASDTRFAGLDREDAEPAKFNTVASDQGLLHAFEDGVDCGLCFGSWQTGAFNNPLYKILFNHLGRRPWAVIFLSTESTGDTDRV